MAELNYAMPAYMARPFAAMPPVTMTFFIVDILIYIIGFILYWTPIGDIGRVMAFIPSYVIDKGVYNLYRIFTSPFYHSEPLPLNILFAMLLLVLYHVPFERLVGSANAIFWFAFVQIFTQVITFLLTWAISQSGWRYWWDNTNPGLSSYLFFLIIAQHTEAKQTTITCCGKPLHIVVLLVIYFAFFQLMGLGYSFVGDSLGLLFGILYWIPLKNGRGLLQSIAPTRIWTSLEAKYRFRVENSSVSHLFAWVPARAANKALEVTNPVSGVQNYGQNQQPQRQQRQQRVQAQAVDPWAGAGQGRRMADY